MNGIPMRIMRDGGQETVYLSTARTGELGAALCAAKAKCRAASLRQIAVEKQVVLAAGRAEGLASDAEALEKLSAEQDVLLEKIAALRAERLVLAQELAQLALEPNHGADTKAILDAMTDPQILKVADAMDLGAEPKDFFLSPEPPKSGSGTAPVGGGTAGSSSTPGSGAGTSKAGA